MSTGTIALVDPPETSWGIPNEGLHEQAVLDREGAGAMSALVTTIDALRCEMRVSGMFSMEHRIISIP